MDKVHMPPPRPKLEDSTLKDWMTERGYDYDTFIIRVGNDPANPVTPISRLAKYTLDATGKHPHPDTIRRWLTQLRRDLGK